MYFMFGILAYIFHEYDNNLFFKFSICINGILKGEISPWYDR